MKYKSGAAFRQALEQRLLGRSRETGTSLVRLRKGVVFDRLLARLTVAARGRWVLKGALALDFRLGGRTRTTKDMDLIRNDSEEAATADLIAAQAVELGDFVTFDIEKVGAPGEELEGAAMRYRVRAELGGRRFEDVIVDIAFSDPLKWAPEKIAGTDLLEFAGIEPIEVPVLPLEQHIAEKVHAYTRIYSSGRTSSRAKDLVDIVLVKQFMVLDAARLRTALVGVFEGRRQHGLPDRFPPPPPEWAVPYRKLANEVGLDPDLRQGHAQAAALLDPVLAGRAAGHWDPERGSWT
ncbi:MAG: nucleotidyl transferase AbiEii/AbiGii toxin family protein [Candidatus Binatus sp.]